MPVGPSDEVVVTNLGDLSNLLSARAFSQAGTELCQMKRDTESPCIISTLTNTILMPFVALFSLFNKGFTAGTHGRGKLAPVRMVVQNVIRRTDFTAWRSFESNWEHNSTEFFCYLLRRANLIWERVWFEPHHGGTI